MVSFHTLALAAGLAAQAQACVRLIVHQHFSSDDGSGDVEAKLFDDEFLPGQKFTTKMKDWSWKYTLEAAGSKYNIAISTDSQVEAYKTLTGTVSRDGYFGERPLTLTSDPGATPEIRHMWLGKSCLFDDADNCYDYNEEGQRTGLREIYKCYADDAQHEGPGSNNPTTW